MFREGEGDSFLLAEERGTDGEAADSLSPAVLFKLADGEPAVDDMEATAEAKEAAAALSAAAWAFPLSPESS